MSWLEIKGLNEEYQKLAADARSIIENAKKSEKRDLTSEENIKFDNLMADAEKIKARVEQIRKLEEAEKSVENRLGREDFNVAPRSEEAQEKRNKAFVKWLRNGYEGLEPEDRAALREGRAISSMTTGTSSHGSEWVPTTFYQTVTKKLKAFGGMREAGITIINTPSGEPVTFPVTDDTGNTGEIVSEGSAATDDSTYDPVSSSRTVTPYLYDSKVVRVSLHLLNSAIFDVEAHIANLLAERLARITNTHFTTGTGSSQPTGVVTAASNGKTAASASTITFAELVDLKHSVDPAYRQNAKFMFKDSTLQVIKKLLDANNQPLWNPGSLALQIPSTIDGTPYVVNQDVAAIATTAKTVYYGDFSAYYAVEVDNFQLFRLNEAYMPYLQVGFIAKGSFGGNLINTSAVKYLTQA